MGLLTDFEIEQEIKFGGIQIEPFEKSLLNPNSYDVRIYNDIITFGQLPTDKSVGL